MSEAYKIQNQDAAYFITMQVVNWIDIFTRKRYCDILINSFKYCIDKKGLRIYAYVIMSNHVHIVASADVNGLSEVVGSFKSFTTRKMIESMLHEPESRRDWMIDLFKQSASEHKRNKNYQIWTHENHALECFSPKFTWQKINYIHENPVSAGMVREAEHYLYSSAIDYTGGKGLLPVCIFHPNLVFS